MSDHDDLVAKYSTPPEEMSPETRELVERNREWRAEKRRNGDVASREQFERQNFAIGLDDNLNPFPVTRQHHDEEQSAQDGRPEDA